MASKKATSPSILRVQNQYLASITTICKDMGWHIGDPIKLEAGEDGFITIENLQPPEVLERRVARLKDTLKSNAKIDDSFRNLVWMYQSELSAIKEGETASELLTQGIRKTMSRNGVLVRKYAPHANMVLSEEACHVLDEVLMEDG